MSGELIDILERARWAPSGDNTQSWRFRILGERELEVYYEPEECLGVINLDHFIGHLSLGALLESIEIASTAHGWTAEITRSNATGPESLLFAIRFRPSHIPPSPLLPFLRDRATTRHSLSTKLIDIRSREILEQCISPEYEPIWIDALHKKAELGWLLSLATKIRLTIPESFRVHRDTIAWNARESAERIPDETLTNNPIVLGLMRWAMSSPDRVESLNRYFGGHLLPRLSMDIIPSLRCGAHCVWIARTPIDGIDATIQAGRAMQRFWLTASSLGLLAQPEMAPLIFSRYAARGVSFTRAPRGMQQARYVSEQMERLLGRDTWPRAAFIMRLGYGEPPACRATRKPLRSQLQDMSSIDC